MDVSLTQRAARALSSGVFWFPSRRAWSDRWRRGSGASPCLQHLRRLTCLHRANASSHLVTGGWDWVHSVTAAGETICIAARPWQHDVLIFQIDGKGPQLHA